MKFPLCAGSFVFVLLSLTLLFLSSAAGSERSGFKRRPADVRRGQAGGGVLPEREGAVGASAEGSRVGDVGSETGGTRALHADGVRRRDDSTTDINTSVCEGETEREREDSLCAVRRRRMCRRENWVLGTTLHFHLPASPFCTHLQLSHSNNCVCVCVNLRQSERQQPCCHRWPVSGCSSPIEFFAHCPIKGAVRMMRPSSSLFFHTHLFKPYLFFFLFFFLPFIKHTSSLALTSKRKKKKSRRVV